MSDVRVRLHGKWRITETGTWDTDYLDLVEPAFIAFEQPGIGSKLRGRRRVPELRLKPDRCRL